MKHKMTLAVELITPDIATEYLKKNKNRRLRKSHVTYMAQQMCRHEWMLTHQGIAFDEDGNLIDGQHRLAAIIESGQSVYMVVVRNVPAACQAVMDNGFKRTAVDAAKLTLGRDVQNRDVAVLNVLVDMARKPRLSYQQILKMLDAFQEPIDWCAAALPGNQRGVCCAVVRSAVILAYCYEPSLDRLQDFCGILTGSEIPKQDEDIAALKLRDAAISHSTRNSVGRLHLHSKAQGAIEAFCRYRKMTKLVAKPPCYPWPLDGNIRGPKKEQLEAILLEEVDNENESL